MAKFILTPNLNPPNNLRRIQPDDGILADMGETDGIAWVLARNQAVGVVPFATAEDKAAHIAELDARDAEIQAAIDGDTAALISMGFTEEGAAERIASSNGETIPGRDPLPDPGPHYIVEETDLPGGGIRDDNEYFFDGWEWDGSAVVVNMARGREIHLAEIRRVRDEELVKLDIPWMKAVEAGDTDAQATIKGQKETLRNLPATFDITTDVDTPEQLKSKWPSELPARE